MLTLADRLIETAADKRWPKPLRQDYEFVARKIRAAQRFIVKETARDAIRSLLISKPSTLVAAASYAKLPFDVCWFEWTPPGYQNLKPGQIEVKRCGAVMGHLFATLILMNAKNSVELTKVEAPEKLNKARRKQGKGELLPYSTVDIKLSKSQERAVAEGRITRAEARRHPVRGHFKVRASGVFWWNESWRGNALRGTVERRAHVVE